MCSSMCSENFHSILIRMFSFTFTWLFPRDYTLVFSLVDELADHRTLLRQLIEQKYNCSCPEANLTAS